MEFGKRHDTADANLLLACYWLATGKSPTCYGETGIMDFGL